MRFIWLFLRTRLVGHAAFGVLVVAGAASVWDDLFSADEGLLLAAATLCPLAAATLIGVTTHSPFGELGRTASRPLGSFRFGQVAGLSLLAVTFLMLAAWHWPGAGEDWILARNLAGFVGITLLAAAVAGARLAWAVPVAVGLGSFFVTINSGGSTRWAWAIQPSGDRLSLVIALALLVLGLAVVTRYGARDAVNEAG